MRADDDDASVKPLLDRVLTLVGVGVMTSVDRQRRDGLHGLLTREHLEGPLRSFPVLYALWT